MAHGPTMVHPISWLPTSSTVGGGITDVKSVLAGNEPPIVSALRIALHRDPNQLIRCPYANRGEKHAAWKWDDTKRMACCT